MRTPQMFCQLLIGVPVITNITVSCGVYVYHKVLVFKDHFRVLLLSLLFLLLNYHHHQFS
jgi:hypothetical protein